MEAQWCLLLEGSNNSYIYCLQEKRLLLWQILPHDRTSSAVSWMHIQQKGISGVISSQEWSSCHFHPVFAASEDNLMANLLQIFIP
ncbi:hypothetical protein OUZ56_029307 [Daphnia magna]|uniref:Uncharacterized protein n=1 Tax=Daphnia magna TaxID=35525 RepID=A0ABR0B6F4_9CRUS|nr:hypothetical protein OUZ56_029307 [Daphnia magna]